MSLLAAGGEKRKQYSVESEFLFGPLSVGGPSRYGLPLALVQWAIMAAFIGTEEVMSKVEELMEVARELPEDKVDGLLTLARAWAKSSKKPPIHLRAVRLGGIASGYDTPLE